MKTNRHVLLVVVLALVLAVGPLFGFARANGDVGQEAHAPTLAAPNEDVGHVADNTTSAEASAGASSADTTETDAPQGEESSDETSETEAPKGEAPADEAPAGEASETEAPKGEAPADEKAESDEPEETPEAPEAEDEAVAQAEREAMLEAERAETEQVEAGRAATEQEQGKSASGDTTQSPSASRGESNAGLEAQAGTKTSHVVYRTHVQTYGWQTWRRDGAMSGTQGQSKRLEGIRIKLEGSSHTGGIQYRTHVQTYGWQGWVKDGALSGTTGESKRLEAIQIKLTDTVAKHYDLYYRVHAQNIGWMGWAKNGAKAGTAGMSKRLEGIQIVLVSKGGAAPATNLGGNVATTTVAFKSGSSEGGGGGGSSTPTSRGASTGALKVKGAQLVDKNGNLMRLHGVSTHGLAWYPQYVNDACFKQLRNQWNANVVRLAMYTAEYGGYCSGGNRQELKDLVKKGVRLATKNDLYAIVDWHILSDNNPNMHVDEAKAFFADISATFKNNTNVLYEICNEPNGGTSWSDIKKYANKIIPVIRKNDPDALIIVGTPTWSQEVDKAAKSPLSYGNVLYSLHFYAATHKDDLRSRMVRAVRGGLPVFVSEFGICDASGNGSIDEASANSWVTTMNSLGVSWCMWSLCNKAESASVLKSSCTATSGFRTADLAASGTWLLKALNGTLPAGSDSSKTEGDGSTNTDDGPRGGTTNTPVSFKQGNLTCTVTLTSSWSNGSGKTCYQYDLSITNNGAARTTWTVTVPFNKSVAFTNGWNGTYKASGSKLAITNANYNGTLAKGATLTGIGFQVTAASGLKVTPR